MAEDKIPNSMLTLTAHKEITPSGRGPLSSGLPAPDLDRRPWWMSPTWLLLVVLVVLPTVLTGVYYGLIATDRYVSEAKLVVRSSGRDSGKELLGSLLGGIGGPNLSNESHVVKEYATSPTIVAELDRQLDLRAIWSHPDADPLSALSYDATEQDLLEHYRDRVSVSYNMEAGLLELRVQAFTSGDAKLIADTIVALCEQLVNDMSNRAREDTVRLTRAEVETAEDRLRAARMELQGFRDTHGDIDPVSSASAIGSIVTGLETELARIRTELAVMETYMRRDNPQVIIMRNRLQSLTEQLDQQRSRLAGAQGTKQGANQGQAQSQKGTKAPTQPLSQTLTTYQNLVLEEEFAQAAYTTALQALEGARIDSIRQHVYLTAFVEPTVPAEATQPRRLRQVGIVLVGSLLAFMVLALAMAAVREHIRF